METNFGKIFGDEIQLKETSNLRETPFITRFEKFSVDSLFGQSFVLDITSTHEGSNGIQLKGIIMSPVECAGRVAIIISQFRENRYFMVISST